MWYLCRRYSAAEALAMGLINAVVPAAALDAEVGRWCDEILAMSPTALSIAKRSFNADSDNPAWGSSSPIARPAPAVWRVGASQSDARLARPAPRGRPTLSM